MLVAETTPFATALTQIPLIGTFVPQILVVLHQIPVVNVVLAPLIGRSSVTTVTVPVGTLVYAPDGVTRKPVAFTTMVESFDGTLISTNYFPAYSVVDSGGATDAPTILNGPGLATAGNIDPTAPDTVDGLVPGINFLREAGYNVVTWDPRGEFDSTGRLQLDSPQYEGQDVKNIITWITANDGYTYQALEGDPANKRSMDRHGRRVLRRRHPVGEHICRPAYRCDHAGNLVEHADRVSLHQRGVQDLVRITLAARVGAKRRPDQSRDLRGHHHR